MRWDVFSKSLILRNYTLFFCCYDHVTCNWVCFVTWWMTDRSHMILLLGMFDACINIVIVEYIYRASSWPYSQNLTSCLVTQSLLPFNKAYMLSCWFLPRLLSHSAYTLSLWPASLSSKPIHPLNPPRVVLTSPSGLCLVIPSHWALTARVHAAVVCVCFKVREDLEAAPSNKFAWDLEVCTGAMAEIVIGLA
jgi:hypothetical protein